MVLIKKTFRLSKDGKNKDAVENVVQSLEKEEYIHVELETQDIHAYLTLDQENSLDGSMAIQTIVHRVNDSNVAQKLTKDMTTDEAEMLKLLNKVSEGLKLSGEVIAEIDEKTQEH